MKNIFKTKLNTASLVLIPACIGINYLGKLFASVLKLPLWLDSIGTCIGGALGGPIIGAICGAANNLIYGFTTGDSITLVYALTSLGIGLVVGIMARLGKMEKVNGCVTDFFSRRSCSSIDLHSVKRYFLGWYNRKCLGRCSIRSNTGSKSPGCIRFFLG